MSHAWLQRQRKQALLDLSEEAGLKQGNDLRKDEIVDTLDEYLQSHKTRLQRNASFEGYYATKQRGTTPFKPRESTGALRPDAVEDGISEVKSVVKARGRRATKVKQESDDDDFLSSPIASANNAASSALSAVTSALSPSGQLTTRTPATRGRRRSQLPGPPSPDVVADIVEKESAAFVERLNDIYTLSGIDERVANLRELCSNVTAIQTTFLLIEAFALQKHVVPWNHAFNTPAIPSAHVPSYGVFLPDLFILLTGFYWSRTLLFSTTNILLPWVVAYFYNLTIRDVKRGNARVPVARYQADPFTFNVVKGLLAWLVYGQGVGFGFIESEVSQGVDGAMYGGATGMIVSSVIGASAALYEAAQRKTVA